MAHVGTVINCMEIGNRGVDALLISTRRTSVRGVSPAENKMTMRLYFCDASAVGSCLCLLLRRSIDGNQAPPIACDAPCVWCCEAVNGIARDAKEKWPWWQGAVAATGQSNLLKFKRSKLQIVSFLEEVHASNAERNRTVQNQSHISAILRCESTRMLLRAQILSERSKTKQGVDVNG